MARRKTSTRRSSTSGIVGQVKRFAKPVMIGLGAAATLGLIGQALGQPGLANNKLVNTGAAFLVGGPLAAGTTLFATGGLGNLFGGGGNGNMEGLA